MIPRVPTELVPGTRVYVYLLGWRVGTLQRVILPGFLTRAKHPAGLVDLVLDNVRLRVRRRLSDLIPVEHRVVHTSMFKHETLVDARAYADQWWTGRIVVDEPSL